jgi:hypothetical protein
MIPIKNDVSLSEITDRSLTSILFDDIHRRDNEIRTILPMKKLLFTAVICLLFFSYAGGQTNVSGTLSVNTTWTTAGSPYNVVGNLGVPKDITLTIQPGVVINFNTQYQIIVKQGILLANGDIANPIIFNGNQAGSAMILFQKANLNNSALSYINLNGPKTGIQLSTNNDDNNSGTLTVNHLTDIHSQIVTNGLTSTALLVIDNSSILNATILGADPASEKIQINNSILNNCTVWSDAYNQGIVLVNDSCINSTFTISICYANITFKDSRVYNSTINGTGADFTAAAYFRNSELHNSVVKMPTASVGIYSSIFKYDASYSNTTCLTVGYGTIDSTVFSGKGSLTAIIRGPTEEIYHYKLKIAHSSFENFATNIRINFLTAGSGTDSINIHYCNFLDRPLNYIIDNQSSRDIWAMNNWWGTTSTTGIDSTIYDFWDDITFGTVHYSPILNTPFNLTTGLPSNNRSFNDISVLPNPFSSETLVRFDRPIANATLMLYNCFGQVVKQLNNLYNQSVIVHRDNLPGGMYFLRLIQDGHLIAVEKLIIR